MHIKKLSPLVACWFALTSAAPRQNEPRDSAWQNWSSSSITSAAMVETTQSSDAASSPTTIDSSQCPPTSDCTSTSTHTSITTITAGSSVVTTVTTTETIGSATTVPTPPGFIPVQSSLPGSSFTGNGSEDSSEKRSLLAESGDTFLKSALLSARSTDDFPGLKGDTDDFPGLNPAYKRGTACTAQPSCSITITTVTSTAVMTEGKSVVTVTSTVTTTTTATTATNTVYAACASNNFADTYTGGMRFVSGGGGYLAVQAVSNEKTAHDCCVTANHIGAGNSSVWGWEPSSGLCQVGLTNSTCPPSSTNPSNIGVGANGTGVIGNGYCGGWYSTHTE